MGERLPGGGGGKVERTLYPLTKAIEEVEALAIH